VSIGLAQLRLPCGHCPTRSVVSVTVRPHLRGSTQPDQGLHDTQPCCWTSSWSLSTVMKLMVMPDGYLFVPGRNSQDAR